MSSFSKTDVSGGKVEAVFPDAYSQPDRKFIDMLTLTQLKKYITQLNKVVRAEIVIKIAGKSHEQLKTEVLKKWHTAMANDKAIVAKKLYVAKSKVAPKLTKAQQKTAGERL